MFRLTAPFYAAVISEAVLTRHMLRLSAQTTSDQRSRLGRAAQHQGSRNTNIAFAARRSNPGEGATMPLSFGLTFVDPRLTPVVLGSLGVMISSPRNAFNLGDFRKKHRSRSFST